MASLGIVLHASLICIVLLTFFSGTASRNIANEILQRLEMVEKLNIDLKKENIKIKLEMAELRDQMDNVVRENREMKKKWNKLDDKLISVYIHLNKSKPEIQSGITPEHLTPPSCQHVAENRKANSVRSVQRIGKFLFDIIFFSKRTVFNFQRSQRMQNVNK